MSDISEMELQLQGYRLATAEILYWMPDHPALLQTFVWQTMDLAPRYPRIIRFLEHWRLNIQATLHTVRVAGCEIIRAGEWRKVDAQMQLN